VYDVSRIALGNLSVFAGCPRIIFEIYRDRLRRQLRAR